MKRSRRIWSGRPERNRRSARVARLLVYLTADEQREFFSGGRMAEIGAAVDVVTVRRPRKGATDLGRLLERTQPTVFLAAWSSPSLPAKLPASLRYVCYVCGSVRTLVSRDHLANGLVVTNWGASISRTVAEAALMHVLACLRRATEWTMRMHARRGWNHDAVASASLFERRVGLHGFGRVARQLVALLRPFQVKVMVFAPDADERAARRWRFRRAGSLGELFAENDVVIELAPLNRETTGVVTERHLRSLPRGGVFVNVGRGEIVDERALVRVAREGRIQFGLDVFATEPLAANHPLRGLLNVSLTPHVAGPTQDRRVDAGDFAIANLRRFAAGQRLRARITPDIYDMST